MPVTFVWPLKGFSSSNKPIETGKKYPVDYWYVVEGWGEVRVLNPFIDKISITAQVASPFEQSVIKSALKDVAKDDDEKEYKWATPKGPPYYRAAVKFICQTNGEEVFVQAAPKQSNTHFIRLEFNPAALTAPGLTGFKKQLDYVTCGAFTWSHVIATGRVTRIDLATDFVNARMSDLIVLSNKGGKSHFYVSDGNLETAYIGLTKAQKASDQKAYDKLQEALDHNNSPSYDSIVHTRIKITKRASTQKLSNLFDL